MAINSIETIPTPRPPSRLQVENLDSPAEINEALNNIYSYAKDVANYNDELYTILHSGALVRSFQVEELLASTIGAGTIAVDQIYLGSDKFELDGALGQIRVKDDAGVVMLEFGEFGSGTDWGIKVRNGSNSIVFQALSNAGVTMDGSIITNATISGSALIGGTITGAKIDSSTITNSNISDVNGSKVATGSLPNTAIASLSANKITLSGTLVCSSTGTAINVTEDSVVTFSGGGDIVMKHSGSGSQNLFILQNSGGTNKLLMGYDTVGGGFGETAFIISQNSAALQVQAADELVLSGDTSLLTHGGTTGKQVTIGADSTKHVTFNARVTSDFLPDADNTYDNGNASLRWQLVRGVTVTSGDLRFENDYILTEPNMLDDEADPYSGLCIMNSNWEQIGFWDKDGNLEISGTIKENVIFKKPKKQRTLIQ